MTKDKVLDRSAEFELTVRITGDKEITKLNAEYLNRDITTDVLSFELQEEMEDGTLYLGDVVVNKNQAKRQAAEYGNDYEREVAELVAHGVLHLLGVHHDDDDEEAIHGVKVKGD